jgi:hypothetical protein
MPPRPRPFVATWRLPIPVVHFRDLNDPRIADLIAGGALRVRVGPKPAPPVVAAVAVDDEEPTPRRATPQRDKLIELSLAY